jgi:hypothetical protein
MSSYSTSAVTTPKHDPAPIERSQARTATSEAGGPSRRRRTCLTAALAIMLVLAFSGVARADLSWSGFDLWAVSEEDSYFANQEPLGVACPSARQCVAVDEGGGQVTFDPTSPGIPKRAAIGSPDGLNAVACPSASVCAAVGEGGEEVSFDPASPGASTVSQNLEGGRPMTCRPSRARR